MFRLILLQTFGQYLLYGATTKFGFYFMFNEFTLVYLESTFYLSEKYDLSFDVDLVHSKVLCFCFIGNTSNTFDKLVFSKVYEKVIDKNKLLLRLLPMFFIIFKKRFFMKCCSLLLKKLPQILMDIFNNFFLVGQILKKLYGFLDIFRGCWFMKQYCKYVTTSATL